MSRMDVIPDYRKFVMEVTAKYKVPCFQKNCCPELRVLEDGRLQLTDDYGGSVVLTTQEFEALYGIYVLNVRDNNNAPSW